MTHLKSIELLMVSVVNKNIMSHISKKNVVLISDLEQHNIIENCEFNKNKSLQSHILYI